MIINNFLNIIIDLFIHVLVASSLLCIYMAFSKKLLVRYKSFSFMMLSLAIYSLAYFFELKSDNLAIAKVSLYLEYIGIASIPLFWTLFSAEYTKIIKINKKAFYLLAALSILLLIAVYTNSLHYLFYKSFVFDKVNNIGVLKSVKGILYYMNIIYYTFSVIFSNILFFKAYKRSTDELKQTNFVLFISSLLPWLGIIGNASGKMPINIDAAPFVGTLMTIIFLYNIIVNDMFESNKKSWLKIFDDVTECAFLLDAKNNIVDANYLTCECFGNKEDIINGSFNDILRLNEDNSKGIYLETKKGPMWFNVRESLVAIKFNKATWKIVILHDITEIKLADEAINKSEELYRVISDNITDTISKHALDGKFTYLSPSCKKILGYAPEELMGTDPYKLFHPTSVEMIKNTFNNLIMTNETEVVKYRIKRKDGSYIWAETTCSIIKNKDTNEATEILCVSRDITERKKHEDEIVYMSNHDALTGLYNRRMFEDVISKIDKSGLLPISVIMGDVNGLKLVNDAYGHNNGDSILIKIAKIIKQECNKNAFVARQGGDEFAAILPSVTYEESYSIIRKIQERCMAETTSELLLNISFGLETKINIGQSLQSCYHIAEERMYRSKLLDSKSTRSTIIANLRAVMEEKTGETQVHCERIAKTAQIIGEHLGMQSYEIEDLKLLSLLHDIGKTGIPDNILLKQGKLKDNEMQIIKKHCEIGFRIASTMPELVKIADGVLGHHERWDGLGYPNGLKGEEIPLIARIVSVLDAYDAMTHDRHYRKAISKELAIKELISCSGTQFDPHIVDLFINKVLKEQLA